MLARSLSPLLPLLAFAVGGLAACNPDATQPDPAQAVALVDSQAVPASLTFTPPPIFWSANPWVGKQVRLRDWTGDAYDRCLGSPALPAANVVLQAQLCYPAPYDGLQWFRVINLGSALNPSDRLRVALQSVYNPAFCVDVAWGTANGNEALQLYPCHYGTNQTFHLPLPSTATGLTSTGRISTLNSNYTMVFEADAPNAAGTVKPAWQRATNAARNYQIWSLQAR